MTTGNPDVLGGSSWFGRNMSSDVVGGSSLALAARQGESRFALRLREAAGEGGERLDKRAALSHTHLPQLDFLSPSPLLCHFLLHLTPLTQVRLVTQYDHHHLFM